MSANSMSLGKVWFSFQGRINRQVYWLWYVLPILAISVVAAILDQVLGTLYMIGPGQPVGILSSVVTLASIWIGLAAGAKRCHDRGRSGWFQLLLLLPVIGWIWLLVELGFLAGTQGSNRFGPDPLQGAESWGTAEPTQSEA